MTVVAAGSPRLGRLLIVPNALDLGHEPVDIRQVLPDEVLRAAAALKFWVAEDARSARAFLKRVAQVHPLACPLQQVEITPWPRDKSLQSDPVWRELLAPAQAGHDIGLISEAGLPAVADPGAELVAAGHGLGLEVVPLPGASALMLALAASGLQGQRFAFNGYLPQDAAVRAARIRELEGQSRRLDQTQIVIETPYRNQALLEGLLAALSATTRLSVSQGLTLAACICRTDSVSGWRSRIADGGPAAPAAEAASAQPRPTTSLDLRTPAVFLFLATR